MYMRLHFSIFIFLLTQILWAQPSKLKFTAEDYIEKYKEDAIKEMKRHGIPASITLAQGMLESGNGNSPLAINANNHFGIKCSNWTGKTYIQDDDTKDECFRKYDDVLDSYEDHSLFLKGKERYAFLFELKTTDYKGWAHGLKKAGYATDPKYPQRLIQIIEDNKLHEFDKGYKNSKSKVQSQKREKKLEFIIAKKGETAESIANENELALFEFCKYNDIKAKTKIIEGEKYYLVAKKKKSETDFHTVKQGETLWNISQKYGVKLKKLRKYNHLKKDQEPKLGEKVKLN